MTIKAAKAIITVKNNYLLQLRDNKKNIYFPNFWGLFGGCLNKNEKYNKAIEREIKEETNLNIKVIRRILSVNFNIIGLKQRRNIIYFECKILDESKIILSEGQRYKFFSFNQIKKLNKVVPMDFVAINSLNHKKKNFTSLSR